ncbi:dystrophin [Corchorus olitorius]|uniref:Dystrophin n=1 Tax=Corchorus olitorius TaxID=93759 RepID=A0A1R3JWC6_9ROSI|nr:dystrophin [Corchorus olitorius]
MKERTKMIRDRKKRIGKGKRVREEVDNSDSDSEDGRRIRQRLQNLTVEELEAIMEARHGQSAV